VQRKAALAIPCLLWSWVGIRVTQAQQPPHWQPARWLRVAGEVRGRAETETGLNYANQADSYYLMRNRLEFTLLLASSFRAQLELQDSRALGRRQPLLGAVRNPLDVHRLHVEWGPENGPGWRVRLGRQYLAFGDERLLGPSNWGNFGQVWDGVRLSWQVSRYSCDWFAASLVEPRPDHWDSPRTNHRLVGVYAVLELKGGHIRVEPYYLAKSARGVRSASGAVGRATVHAFGARTAWKTAQHWNGTLELVQEHGTVAASPMRAWALYASTGRQLAISSFRTRVYGEYGLASGDSDPNDGRRGTFDQFYPTNHDKYGIADRIGWRNIHTLRWGWQARLPKQTTLQLDYHNFWLASRADALYAANGAPVAFNAASRSRHVGQEVDIQFNWQATARLALLAGYAHLIPGAFLKASSPGQPAHFGYAGWLFRF